MMSRSWVEIDLGAVAANAKTLMALAPTAELCAVVKANAYGHGPVAVANAALAAGATRLAVAQVDEGIALRQAGVNAEIWVLSEPAADEFTAAKAHDLQPTVCTTGGIRAAAAAATVAGITEGEKLVVHLKVDTGMYRTGCQPAEAGDLAARIVGIPTLALGSVWTHLSSADEPAAPDHYTQRQLDRYRQVLAELAEAGIRPPLRHAANSAGTMAYPEAHLDVVRCGIALYGMAPSPYLADHVPLHPALRWCSAVSLVKRVPAGAEVSYGRRSRLDRPTTLATVPVGYADGYRRASWNTAAGVLCGGKVRPIVGVVTMDQLVIDCGDDPVEIGDEVVLLGSQGEVSITADDLAAALDTINYEITTTIGPRVERRYFA